MNAFHIEKDPHLPDFLAVVYSTCYRSPLGEIKEIESELAGSKGLVLFDLFLSNGNNSNRYITGEFDGEAFLYPSFQVLEKKTEVIREQSASFYFRHQDLLKNSILTSMQQKMVKKGIKLR